MTIARIKDIREGRVRCLSGRACIGDGSSALGGSRGGGTGAGFACRGGRRARVCQCCGL